MAATVTGLITSWSRTLPMWTSLVGKGGWGSMGRSLYFEAKNLFPCENTICPSERHQYGVFEILPVFSLWLKVALNCPSISVSTYLSWCVLWASSAKGTERGTTSNMCKSCDQSHVWGMGHVMLGWVWWATCHWNLFPRLIFNRCMIAMRTGLATKDTTVGMAMYLFW